MTDKMKIRSEKKPLLRVYHRAQNYFQLISSLISLQLHSKNAQSEHALENIQRQIQVMSLAFEKLYRDLDKKTVDPGKYIRGFAAVIREYHSGLPHPVDIKIAAN